jgi:hypothetical protein
VISKSPQKDMCQFHGCPLLDAWRSGVVAELPIPDSPISTAYNIKTATSKKDILSYRLKTINRRLSENDLLS